MPPRKKFDCPICGQYMDFLATTYRNDPYIDGETYRYMCFGCAHVPQEYVQKGDEQLGPFYTYKRLCSAKELHETGSCDTLYCAQKCVKAVKSRLKKVGKVKLDKLKLKRPLQEYDINYDHQEAQLKKEKSHGRGSSKRSGKSSTRK